MRAPAAHAAAWLRAALMACLAALLALPAGAWAQDVQAVPALSGRVVDSVGLMPPTERGVLEAKLADFEARSGPQIVLLLVATSAPEDIAAYAQRVADTWKIGRRGVGDGVLVVVARDDRRVRIEVAKALEGAVPDLAARQIIDRTIAPAFKRGDYAGGLSAGVDALIARIQGEHLPAPQARQPSAAPAGDRGFDYEQLGLFFFVLVPVAGSVLGAVLGRKLGTLATAGLAGTAAWWLTASALLGACAGLAALVLVGVIGLGAGGRRSGGRGLGSSGGPPIIWGGGSGHGGGFGGGGGFGSGGGGDFGGGGASGDW